MEHLATILQSTLRPDASERQAAEAGLENAIAQQGTALALTQIALMDSLDIPLRQISGLALKRLVRFHWSPFFETFKGPTAVTLEEKQQVRPLLLEQGLACNSRPIRAILAAVVSEVAHSDFPDEWPNLTQSLITLLSSNWPDAVHGALTVLADFCKTDLTEDQLLPLASDLLPKLLVVFENSESFSAVSRARSLSILSQCVTSLFMVKDQYPAAVAEATSAILPQWLKAVHHFLAQDLSSDLTDARWDNLAIRSEAFKALDTILSSFPKTIQPDVGQWLQLALSHLFGLADVFQRYILSADADGGPQLSEDATDVSADLSKFIGQIIDWTQHLGRKSWCKPFLIETNASTNAKQATPQLQAVLSICINFSQTTAEEEDNWQDPNAFVTDQDDEGVAFSLRMACLDLTETLSEVYGKVVLPPLQTAAFQALDSAGKARAQGQSEWWKGYEAVLFSVGAVAEDILELLQDREKYQHVPPFDLAQLFQAAVLPFLQSHDVPFLQGRAFVFASQFITALPESSASDFMSQAIQTLEHQHTPVAVKLSAVRAISNCFASLSSSIATPFCGEALKNFVPILAQTSSSTLNLLIESVEAVLRCGLSHLSAEQLAPVIHSVIDAWQREISDPSISFAVADLLAAIAASQTPAAQSALQSQILPRLKACVEADRSSHLPSAAVDVLDTVLTGAKAPLPPHAFDLIASALLPLLHETDDRGIIQSGLNVVIQLCKKAWDQVQTWHDPTGAGRSGLEAIFQVIARTIEPDQSESAGLFVGDLIVHVLRQAGESALPVVPDLLRALLSRLATAQTASFSQSLIMPFALLLQIQPDPVLDLLDQIGQVPGSQESALHLLVRVWCDNVDTWQGFWNSRVSSLALANLLLLNRQDLQSMIVRGDLIVEPSSGILTRSRAKARPDKYQEIPFPAKVLKVLAADLQAEEQQKMANVDLEDVASDDGDGDWEEEEEAETQQELLNQMGLGNMPGLSGALGALDKKDADDEEDFADDPISTMDFRASIRTSLQRFMQQVGDQRAGELAAVLTAEERKQLQQALSER